MRVTIYGFNTVHRQIFKRELEVEDESAYNIVLAECGKGIPPRRDEIVEKGPNHVKVEMAGDPNHHYMLFWGRDAESRATTHLKDLIESED